MSILIIAEKPSVAERIAISFGNASKLRDGKVSYFEINLKENKSNKESKENKENVEKIYVCSAVGHLYRVAQKTKDYSYPTFDVEWRATYETDKNADYTKDYIKTIENLASIVKKEKNNIFINSCDYDIEGEIIGFNAIKFACNVDPFKQDVKRMKFSTLTKQSILNAYKNLESTNKGMAYAGMTRHILDWFWGINLSKALSSSLYKILRKFQAMSIGRVQGPTLKILTDRERDIKNFVPKKYWEIYIQCKKNEHDMEKFLAQHKEGKIFDKEKALKIKEKCKVGKAAAIVKEVKKKRNKISPPPAFDLTELQTEAYAKLKIDPRRTLELAQDLYTSGIISYPRTASNQLTDPIGYYLDIIMNLSNNYIKECKILFEKNKKQKIFPNNGKKEDPAHPAIHPTGEDKDLEKFSEEHKKLYDLIARRFLATFGDNAIREIVTANINNNDEIFIAKGATTIELGWIKIYKYAKFEEEELPELKKDDKIFVEKINMDEKETQPPKRYNVSSIIAELERKNLGTKATRANIVDTLFKRNYVKTKDKAIEVTPFGIAVVDTLEKHCSDIIDENLTRKFEKDMENIQNLKTTHDKVIDEAKKTLIEISNKFKKEEFAIGKALLNGMKAEEYNKRNEEILFKCLKCGGNMAIRKGPYGNFAGCSNYPNCKWTVKLPQGNLKIDKECNDCGAKKILVFINKKKMTFCPNPECAGKKK
ncbi:MAG: DNA topoisomerase I [Candidatus Altiarchaeum hamiconexum]|uniref:DNA topoisomerase 1 n=1 Tax=Candidatus Altarchaeum hamiconexum TaxID=1803513 RepID=A0A8J7YUB1_9ARCH|nr:DNA topoisomerase I [Candidatus Altarchaeum hamiconexum]PIV27470.1 MAG: DNA topoisomerase I [Candidatus Altarchaeum sp. CG03_land_8_20_14_0_80_32_618]PIX48572.1 MAG: DNA topoisomerase I [Candidatus Altarchaeum sp. CG_4_8_14_3_um_filter_33_2054]PJC13583.1 MAG: DNA topoisomerase I [Candidatus Altarchaeum sp. CG_4_9_14_0_8_um_filter_32_206]NCN68210.1 DNA topoisomerase I [Candidatus Altarchaeum hamiconexum]